MAGAGTTIGAARRAMMWSRPQSCRQKGLQLHFSELKGPVHDRLARSEVKAWLSGRIFMTQAEAFDTLSAGG